MISFRCRGWTKRAGSLRHLRHLMWVAAIWPALVSANPVLERVVIVSRHGVRAPSKPPAALAKFAEAPWPDWPVAPGDLTPHGADALSAMGAWLRTRYAASGLLRRDACPAPGQIFLWADGKDRRTIESGQALLAGLAPGCGLAAAHGPDKAPDKDFAAIEAGACPMTAAERAQVAGDLGTGLAHLPDSYAPALAALGSILDPQAPVCPAHGGAGPACALEGSNVPADGEEGPQVKGPLATGASLAEDLALEYAQGFDGDQLGWGRMDKAALTRAMRLHNMYSALTRRDPIIGAHNGAFLAQRIAAALEGGTISPAQRGVAAPMTIFVGHDTNLDNLAAVFGVDWQLDDQPDNTPPDGALTFEVWRQNDGTRAVRMAFRYQTADQLRAATAQPLDVRLAPGWCSSGCTPDAVADHVRHAVPPQCLSKTQD